MTLRADAIAAYKAEQADLEGNARSALAACLNGEDVSGLTIADSQVTDLFTRYVFTDGDLNLAVALRDGEQARVHLVTGRPGQWTDQGLVTSLEQLGELLEAAGA